MTAASNDNGQIEKMNANQKTLFANLFSQSVRRYRTALPQGFAV